MAEAETELVVRPRARAETQAPGAGAGALATIPCRQHFTSGRCARRECPYLHDAEVVEKAIAARRSQRATSAPPTLGGPPQQRASPDALRGLPVFTWTGPKSPARKKAGDGGEEEAPAGDDDDDDNRTCAICLEPFANRKPVTALPCIHKFHADCVFPWIKKQGTCPKCFLPVPTNEPPGGVAGGRSGRGGRGEGGTRRPGVRAARARSEPHGGQRTTMSRAQNGRWLVTPTPNYVYTQPKGLNMIGEVLFGPQGGGVAWVPNSISRACMLCAASFSATRRRHHCRVCGILSCKRCIVKKPIEGYLFDQYCCVQCLTTYQRNEGDIAPPWWDAA